MALNLKKLYNTSKDLAKNGVWVDIAEGIKFKIAKKDNDNFKNAVLRLLKEKGFTQYQITKGNIPNDAWGDIGVMATAESILVDWEGVIDEATGKPVKYTPEIGFKEMMADEEFLKDIQKLSEDVGLFQAKVEAQEIEKQ